MIAAAHRLRILKTGRCGQGSCQTSVFRVEKTKVTRSCPTTVSATMRCLSKPRNCSRRCCYCRRTGVIRCGGLRRSTGRTLTPSVKPCASWNEPVTSNVAASVAACAELCTRSTSSRKQSQHPKTCTGFAYIG